MSLHDDKPKGNKVYLAVMNGKLVHQVGQGETPVEGATSRQNKLGNIVWEKMYSGVSGKLKNVSITLEKFGKELHIEVMNKSGEQYVIQTAVTGGYAFGFLTRIPNIKITKEVKICPFAVKDETKKKDDGSPMVTHTIVVYQKKDESLDWTKDNTEKLLSFFDLKNAKEGDDNFLPPIEKVFDAKGKPVLDGNGKQVTSNNARIEFFETMVGDNLQPELARMWTPSLNNGSDAEEHFEQEVETPDPDDFTHEPADKLDFDELDKEKEAAKKATKKTAKK